MARIKNGNSTAGAGSRSDGRVLSVPGMTEAANAGITREIYEKIIAAGGVLGRPQKLADGSLFIPVIGMKDTIKITNVSPSELKKIARAVPKIAKFIRNPTTGKLEKQKQ